MACSSRQRNLHEKKPPTSIQAEAEAQGREARRKALPMTSRKTATCRIAHASRLKRLDLRRARKKIFFFSSLFFLCRTTPGCTLVGASHHMLPRGQFFFTFCFFPKKDIYLHIFAFISTSGTGGRRGSEQQTRDPHTKTARREGRNGPGRSVGGVHYLHSISTLARGSRAFWFSLIDRLYPPYGVEWAPCMSTPR